MIVALDTNIWLKERLLRSAAGVALLYAIHRIGARILLPDSTRREILAGVERDGSGAVASIERGLRIVQELTGARPEIQIPSIEKFRKGGEERLDELSDLILPVEVTHEHLAAALDRVTTHRAPARTSEQFRDCLLWECIIDQDGDCLLVTSDGDFLEKTSGRVALAPELDKEAEGRVKVFPTLAELLRAIEPQVPQEDTDHIATLIAREIQTVLEDCSAQQSWTLGPRTAEDLEVYMTERPGTIAVVFELQFKALNGLDLDGDPVEEGVARVSGECLLSDNHGISELRMDGIQLFTPAGDKMRGGAVYVHVPTMYIGRPPDVPYKLRSKLPFRTS
jgi:hypothetical protein